MQQPALPSTSPSSEYQDIVSLVKSRRLTRKFQPPVISKTIPVLTAGINGFIIGSFLGGAFGSVLGFYRMFKYHKLSRFPATVLMYGMTAGISLGIASMVMKEGSM